MGLALAFVAAHLPFLPQSLEDIDSINFALGLRHFDPALHQPHPPGYPLYIGLGHVSLAVLSWLVPALPDLRVEAVALAVWSLAGGALAIIAAALFYRSLEDVFPDDAARVSPWLVSGSAALLAVAPIFSISGVRPLSDMPGLALALLAQALIVRGIGSPWWLVVGAFVAGLSGGIRVQSAVLTVPLFLGVLIGARRGHAWTHRVLAVVAGVAGGLSWGIPLLVLSGGVQGYLRALGSQAGEDFAWVDMLWSHPTPRLLALALYRTLALSWGDPRLGLVVTGLATAGALAALVKTRRMLGVVCLAFLPYAMFHLLLQETATIRYALPLVPPIVWLAMMALQLAGRVSVLMWAAVAASALIVSVPTAIDYGQQAHPAFRAIVDMISEGEGVPPAAVYSHFALYRSLQAAAPDWLHPVPPVRQKEWLGPVQFFRDGGARTVWFLGDPLRTDMALFDPANILTNEANPWRAWAHAEMGGVRPVGAVWHRIQPPGWMVGEGWSLTPEAGGRVRATRTGLDHGPIEAFVRRRSEPATFLIGGLHLGTAADAPAELTVAIDGSAVETWEVPRAAGGQPFVRFVRLPGGVPQGAGNYASLRVSARSLEPGRPVPEIAIRQFDLQPDGGRPLMAFSDGWYEDEYSPETGQRWRWTGASAQLRLMSSRTVVLRVRGESPVKYVGAAPTVRITAGARTLATFHPAADFSWRITVPADALTEAHGVVTIETDRTYLPGAAEGTGDTRTLGLRVFECRADLE
ncbi:MAG TPA: hypothetical protein VGQ37_14525 [Vicinamibacterales bacterium]|nr:hypothetical protein [Vicinamibacterales bacterium]